MSVLAITRRWNGELIGSDEAGNLKELAWKLIQEGADLSGADLHGTDLSGADLSGADLRGADLSGADLRGADLSNADLSGADLSNADLSGADLSGADLRGAALSNADLRGADLSNADLNDVPIIPHIDRVILDAIESNDNRLEMKSWHTCNTTHCRAGWAIHLAGKAGYALEREIGPSAAGALIYAASRPGMRLPDFVTSNEDAMTDIRACAAMT